MVEVVKLARENIEMKRKNATMSSRQTYLKAKLVETRAAGRTMPSQIMAAKAQIKLLNTKLGNAQLPFEKLPNGSARTKADL